MPQRPPKGSQEMALKAKALAHDIGALVEDVGLEDSEARIEAIRDRCRQMPVSARRSYLRACKGGAPSNAIKAMCMECIGWEREEVRRCTAKACPLYAHRPYCG